MAFKPKKQVSRPGKAKKPEKSNKSTVTDDYHFRNHTKRKHPALIVKSEKNKTFDYSQVTSVSGKDKKHKNKNIKLDVNPNKAVKGPAYLTPIKNDKQHNFGNPRKDMKLAKSDIPKVKELEAKHRAKKQANKKPLPKR